MIRHKWRYSPLADFVQCSANGIYPSDCCGCDVRLSMKDITIFSNFFGGANYQWSLECGLQLFNILAYMQHGGLE